MPSPFPGMDPWLESHDLWQGVHHAMITFMISALNATLPDSKVAVTDVRLYVVERNGAILPGLVLRETQARGPVSRRGTAVLDVDEPQTIELPPYTAREGFIEIRTNTRPSRVLTVIELLSPSNKRPGCTGYREYRAKQQEVLESDINLLEIDLLRGGAHTVAVPRYPLEDRANWDYLVCLHRGAKPFFYDYWPIGIRGRLPRIRVPLDSGMDDAILDLQAVLNIAYDSGRYQGILDYDQPPEVHLAEDDAVWATTLLHGAGLRGVGPHQ